MSPKKILFLAIIGVVVVAAIFGILYLKNNVKKAPDAPEKLTVWITDGTSEDYASLAEGFKAYAPEYKSTNIVFEKKTTDPIRYRTLLLSTMSDGTSPDIFMLGSGEDVVLQAKAEPIPNTVINFSNFDKDYDDIFLDLITTSGAKDPSERFLLGVPLGFETMGMYYNKSLIREVPTTWSELDALYSNGIGNAAIPSNLGLGPRYTPNAADVIGLFYQLSGNTDITKNDQNGNGLGAYVRYREATAGGNQSSTDVYAPIVTLAGMTETLDTEKKTTLDLFLDGQIGIVFGYSSLVKELEKSAKRVGSSNSASVILTDKIPSNTPNKGRKNIARYDFFVLSRHTENAIIGAKFLEYLLTPDAEKRYLESHPYMIAAQRAFWTAQQNTRLSDILSRTTLAPFIPNTNEELMVFSYGLKAEFINFLTEYIDRTNNIDISNISDRISQNILCAIQTYSGKDLPQECEKM